ncbi:MAG: selenocysteine-specific translation elongation factor [Caldilineaceae bacterium]
MRVIGTAGHVDHGKSTLVRALTGIDPDRLQEEKARGMTIDLGFAWVDLPLIGADGAVSFGSQSVGIVDVPGHIDFIKNMLAGVGSIDAAVLAIAADEGVMPQTREHLAILDLLAVPAGVVALTKTDLIDEPEWLDLVELDVAELLDGTRLADAEIVRVSATTGAGLDELRRAVAGTLAQLAPRRNRARPRLPIDRIFTLSGFGTVVTGTLSDGHFRVGDAVEIQPSGRQARIRGLQTHQKQIWQGEPGSRLAMNLSGVGTDEIRRGDVVIKPDTITGSLLIDVSFRLLADAPKALEHNYHVDFFSGATEVPARVRLLGTEKLEPGQEGWLQLQLERPVIVAAGDRYILRQPSPSATLGGGVVLSPQPRRRWRRFDASVLERFKTLARGAPDEILLQTLARTLALTPAELMGQSGLDLEIAQDALSELTAAGAIFALEMGNDAMLLALEAWEGLREQTRQILEAFHAQSPLRQGMARGELRSRLQSARPAATLSVRFVNALIEEAQKAEIVNADDNLVWLHDFQVNLTLHQQAMTDELLAAFAAAPYAPPNAQESLRTLGDSEELLDYLLESGQLVRLGGGVLFRQGDFDAMREQIIDFARAHGSITLAQARDLFQTSRKYVQALLEELDAQRITRREGDERVLRIA